MKKFIAGFFFAVFVVIASAILWYVIAVGGVYEGCQKCRMAKNEVKIIGIGLYLFYEENGLLPERLEELEPEYLVELSRDPWGGPYMYKVFEYQGNTCFVIWTLGSDSKYGGKDHASDFTSEHERGHCFEKRG